MADSKVFVSHSGHDAEWVHRFADLLRARGFEVWHPGILRPNESLEEAMEKALRESDWFVLLVDRDSVASPALYFDMGAGLGLGRRIVTIVAEDLDESQLPLPLRRRRRLVKETPERTAEELLSRAA